jgi:uncharacterized protein DUF2784
MLASVLADAVLLLHVVFVAFVIGGGLLVLRWPKLAWLHLPAAVWGAVVELSGSICPLTPLENRLRERAGLSGYSGGFLEHYLEPLIYPTGLTADSQIVLGLFVILVNVVVYAALVVRRNRRRRIA